MKALLPLCGIALAAATAAPPAPRPAATPGPSCIDADRIVSRRATAADALTVELAGGRRVAMMLAGPCPHLADLNRNYVLVFDQRDGSRLCRGARFQVVDPLVARAGGTAGFPFCRVARFTAAGPDGG